MEKLNLVGEKEMALFSRKKKYYEVPMYCTNCRMLNEAVKIEKGVRIDEALEKGLVVCGYCGCNTLVEYRNKDNEDEESDLEDENFEEDIEE